MRMTSLARIAVLATIIAGAVALPAAAQKKPSLSVPPLELPSVESARAAWSENCNTYRDQASALEEARRDNPKDRLERNVHMAQMYWNEAMEQDRRAVSSAAMSADIVRAEYMTARLELEYRSRGQAPEEARASMEKLEKTNSEKVAAISENLKKERAEIGQQVAKHRLARDQAANELGAWDARNQLAMEQIRSAQQHMNDCLKRQAAARGEEKEKLAEDLVMQLLTALIMPDDIEAWERELPGERAKAAERGKFEHELPIDKKASGRGSSATIGRRGGDEKFRDEAKPSHDPTASAIISGAVSGAVGGAISGAIQRNRGSQGVPQPGPSAAPTSTCHHEAATSATHCGSR